MRAQDPKQALAAWLRAQPTPAETVLWERLRRRPGGLTFWNQHVVRGWIADFYCPAARLVIEVDGGVHTAADRARADQLRDEVMRAYRFGVLRFANAQVTTDVDAVVAHILATADARDAQAREAAMAARRERARAQRAATPPAAEPPPPTKRRPAGRRVALPTVKARFRCTWCLRDWVAPLAEHQTCRRCPGAEVDRLCRRCNLRQASDRQLDCATCRDAAAAARADIGSGVPFGQGHHRARKLN